jgi:hypothetical protein
MNERAMCAMFMAFMTCFCFSPPGSSPPADSALMFIGILTALQSHDLAESMLVGLAAGAWCLHVYMYTYARLLARHVTLVLCLPIAELFQTELFPFNFIFMCEGPLIYVWLYPLIYVCLLFFSSNVNTATPDHFSAWFPQSRKGYKMTS